MEFPDLGKQCSEPTCKRLDFLPLKCDACEGIFCHDHMRYTTHNCPSAYKKDVQVPVCPLCSQPVPVGRHQQPDDVVGAHMDNDCQSEPAQARRKVFVNKCSLKGCRQKEIVRVECPECSLNFCMRHRHMQDHKCVGKEAARRQAAADAAQARRGKHAGNSSGAAAAMSSAAASASAAASRLFSRPAKAPAVRTPVTVSAIQGSMSEDEALARALAESMIGTDVSPQNAMAPALPVSQEEADRQLAMAIAASEQEQQGRRPVAARSSQDKSCHIS